MESKPIVSIRLMGGLCNILFQIGAMKGYAEKYNCQCRIYKSLIQGNHHTSFDETLQIIIKLFPDIIIESSPDIIMTESQFDKIIDIDGDNACKYVELPSPSPTDKMILLKGYFQSEKYFPNNEPFLNNFKSLYPNNYMNISGNKFTFDNTYFIHIRMGDYIGHYLHYLGYKKYLTNAINLINKYSEIHYKSKPRFLICSNETNKEKVLNELGPIILNLMNEYIFEGDGNGGPLGTLVNMGKCRGGIGVNSSFSWFGGYLCNMMFSGVGEPILILPNKWFNEAYIPFEKYRDIYPTTWKGLRILEV